MSSRPVDEIFGRSVLPGITSADSVLRPGEEGSKPVDVRASGQFQQPV